MRRGFVTFGLVFTATLLSGGISAEPVNEKLIDGLEYRLIGPWRGGR